MAAALDTLQRRGDFLELLNYGPTAGGPDDREAAAQWLRPRLGVVSADDVVICAGGAALLDALVTTFTKPGDTIVAEELTYPGIRAVCRHFDRSLVGISMDAEGMIPSALVEACERVRPRALYCTPTVQNPTTATMSTERRSQIAAIAERFDLAIFEDDAYGMIASNTPAPLASFAPERTYYMASLSKCLSPGLRLAYCVGPETGRAAMTEGVRVMTILAPKLMVATASQWIEDGSAIAIRDAIRSECASRQKVAREVLVGQEIAADPQGPHLWLSLRGEWQIPELGDHLRSLGVAAKGDGFAVSGRHPNALRVALGAPETQAQLVDGLEVLRSVLRDERMRLS